MVDGRSMAGPWWKKEEARRMEGRIGDAQTPFSLCFSEKNHLLNNTEKYPLRSYIDQVLSVDQANNDFISSTVSIFKLPASLPTVPSNTSLFFS